ncbi:hypothetical protein [Larkinella knui]|uniref:DUF3575 domain-containing protein n=1 Tax=Larkinella knui TaxID=2025310 RepID=A0A3P1CV30_9BACT|nr:hypothetical protein [Larkinella knui]RRB17131.1 hypothetical protein EHT87_02295 [Larkinella knui]
MKTVLIYSGLIWLGLTAGVAQTVAEKPPVDSLAKSQTATTQHYPVRWTVNLDFRDSFVNRHHVNVWGVNTGLVFGPKRHQITIGYYWLTYNSYLHLIDLHRNAAKRLNLAYYTKTDMAFGSVMLWHNFINNRRWMFSIPVELGAGRATAVSTDTKTDSATGRSRWDFFMPVQVGVYGQWKASRWIGLSSQIGYRISIFQTNVNQHYNGSYYSVGTVIYPEFFKDIWAFIRRKPKAGSKESG